MKITIGLTLFSIFLFLSALHFYWGFEGKWGADATIPTDENNEKVINPKMFECLVVAFGLLGVGVLILVKSQIIFFALPKWLNSYGLWLLSALFAIRAMGDFKYVGFFKRIKSTKFAELDTKYYSPLCVCIGILMVVLQMLQ